MLTAGRHALRARAQDILLARRDASKEAEARGRMDGALAKQREAMARPRAGHFLPPRQGGPTVRHCGGLLLW